MRIEDIDWGQPYAPDNRKQKYYLKPCPVCKTDKPNMVKADGLHYQGYYEVQCRKCGLRTIESTTPYLAMKSWNKRVGDELNVIFLDVDGILTYESYSKPELYHINMDNVHRLQKIVNETNSIIVLSSTWRYGYKEDKGTKDKMYLTLEKCLMDDGMYIADTTRDLSCDFPPEIQKYFEEGVDIDDIPIIIGTGRAAEIYDWIRMYQPNYYLILDDEDWCFSDYGLDKVWVRGSAYDPEHPGLTDEDVTKSIAILKGEIKDGNK